MRAPALSALVSISRTSVPFGFAVTRCSCWPSKVLNRTVLPSGDQEGSNRSYMYGVERAQCLPLPSALMMKMSPRVTLFASVRHRTIARRWWS